MDFLNFNNYEPFKGIIVPNSRSNVRYGRGFEGAKAPRRTRPTSS